MSPEKAAMREAAAGRRERAAQRKPDAGSALAAQADQLLSGGEPVSVYWPIGSEIDPRPLARRLAAAGARVLLPAARGPARAGALEFRLWAPGEELIRSRFGVLEPGETAPALRPALILAPLLAFDRGGRRLGYGAGYYDRALRALRASGGVRAVGLAFAEQEVPRVPDDPWDERLDAVLTDVEFLICGSEAR